MKSIEKIFGIKIKNSGFFKTALTHSSYTKENEISSLENYERLEFLGDAVLKLAVSDILFRKYSKYEEGELSKMRSVLVSDSVLASFSKELGISEHIILSLDAQKQKVRNLESINACAFEALLGAYYLDGKFTQIMKFLEEILVPHIADIEKNPAKYNAKATLQEYTQSKTKKTPLYRLIEEKGPAHNRKFVMEVLYEDAVLAQCEGKSKKEAEQKCAMEACKKLGVMQ